MALCPRTPMPSWICSSRRPGRPSTGSATCSGTAHPFPPLWVCEVPAVTGSQIPPGQNQTAKGFCFLSVLSQAAAGEESSKLQVHCSHLPPSLLPPSPPFLPSLPLLSCLLYPSSHRPRNRPLSLSPFPPSPHPTFFLPLPTLVLLGLEKTPHLSSICGFTLRVRSAGESPLSPSPVAAKRGDFVLGRMGIVACVCPQCSG